MDPGSVVGGEGGERRVQKLGRVSRMTKSEAKEKLAEILRPINASMDVNPNWTFGDFVEDVYFPFYRRKWKRSTKMTTQDRIKFHLVGEFKKRRLSEMKRDELQNVPGSESGEFVFQHGRSFEMGSHVHF